MMSHSLLQHVRPDLPFDQEDANRYLPWIIAVMTALTCLMLALGITMNSLFLEQHEAFEHRVQIQIPYADGEEQRTAERLSHFVSSMPGIEAVTPLPPHALGALLEPWLGSQDMLDMLPVPVVIEVDMLPAAYADGTINRTVLQDILKPKFPGITIDDYQEWVAEFNQITQSIKLGIFAIALLILLAALTVILLITRASVQLHFPIITLLHRMGAEDGYIIRQFQHNAVRLTLKGVIIGTLIAALLYALLEQMTTNLTVAFIPEQLFSTAHLWVFLGLPLLMLLAVIAITATSLRRMLTHIY